MIYAVQTIHHAKEIVQFMSRICSGNSEGKVRPIQYQVGNVKDM